MKKKIWIFLCLFGVSFISGSVFAQSKEVKLDHLLIIEVGVGNEEDLKINGAILMNHNVNFKQVGTYVAEYYISKTEIYIKRTIEVINQKQLLEGTLYYERIGSVLEEDAVVDVVVAGEDGLFVVGNRLSEDEIIQTNYTQTYAFVRYYKKGVLQWERLFNDSYSEASGAVRTSHGLVVLMSREVGRDDSDIVILEITNNNNITREFTIGGNEVDRGYAIYFLSNKLYCFVTSGSSSGELSLTNSYFFIGYLVIDYLDFSLENKQMLGNSIRSDLVDVEYHKAYGFFYLLVRSMGTFGSFKGSNNSYEGTMLVGFGLDGNIENIVTLSVTIDEQPALIVEDYEGILVVSTSMFSKNTLRFNLYTAWLHREVSFTYAGQSGEKLSPMKIKNNMNDQNTLLALTNNASTQSRRYDLLWVHKSGSVRLALKEELNQIIMENHYGYMVCKDGSIEKFITVMGTFHHQLNHNFKEYTAYNLFLHYEYMGVLGLGQSQNVYGEYQEDKISSNGLATLILNSIYYIELKTNVRSHQIYDIDTAFVFNGVGHLNGVPYQSGEKITKAGQYEFIIVGNDERKIFQFEVRALSVDVEDRQPLTIEVNDVSINSNPVTEEKYAFTDCSFSEALKPTWLIVVGILFLFIGTSLVVPLRLRRKK